QWEGSGLDVETVNGSIKWEVPADYSAQLLTGTTNGSLKTTLPQIDPKSRKHEVNATLGKGGQVIKAVTTNGSVVQSSEAAAKEHVTAIRINTTSNKLLATGGEEKAAVSYEVFVPRRTALALTTQNGSIHLAGVQSAITFSAQNGSVSLADLGGQ
nr:hypothetical protein [Tanacetum cinerariifolium]